MNSSGEPQLVGLILPKSQRLRSIAHSLLQERWSKKGAKGESNETRQHGEAGGSPGSHCTYVRLRVNESAAWTPDDPRGYRKSIKMKRVTDTASSNMFEFYILSTGTTQCNKMRQNIR
jgi:hypothetical protein